MILVDTSVWIDYFRGAENAASLADLLINQTVTSHPWVLGELAVGNLGKKRQHVLDDLRELPQLPAYPIEELIGFIEHQSLSAKGLSLTDVHLLYASIATATPLWTHDRTLHHTAKKLGFAYRSSR